MPATSCARRAARWTVTSMPIVNGSSSGRAPGATHLLCTLDGDATVASLARWLIPEVGMVAFPRVVAEAPLPAAWPSAE